MEKEQRKGKNYKEIKEKKSFNEAIVKSNFYRKKAPNNENYIGVGDQLEKIRF